ncbi:MAG: hypothetical protein IKN54_07910 [Lachnospiraceae bacterium]|nr:hypothetical protein [Lachnospiraceae bacterium]
MKISKIRMVSAVFTGLLCLNLAACEELVRYAEENYTADQQSESQQDESKQDGSQKDESINKNGSKNETSKENSYSESEYEQHYEFRNDYYLEQHYEKHGKEMGFSSSEDYEEAACEVINNPEALHKYEAEDNDEIYYIEDTNEFVVVSTDGYIRTYFEPSDGISYYNRQ